jgi:sortase A
MKSPDATERPPAGDDDPLAPTSRPAESADPAPSDATLDEAAVGRAFLLAERAASLTIAQAEERMARVVAETRGLARSTLGQASEEAQRALQDGVAQPLLDALQTARERIRALFESADRRLAGESPDRDPAIEAPPGPLAIAAPPAGEHTEQLGSALVGGGRSPESAPVVVQPRSSAPSPVVSPRSGSALVTLRKSKAAGPAAAARRRQRQARVATWVRNLGFILLLFVVFQYWGTGVDHERDQRALQRSFGRVLAQRHPAGTKILTAQGPKTVTDTPPPPPRTGEAVAMLKIPRIGLQQAVVEGTNVLDLRRGPGHYSGTPLPGERGNAAIAGHRTTYGGPFNRIDELRPGDPILVSTVRGNYTYRVAGKRVVSPSQYDVVESKHDNRITLTTCNPKYFATTRLVVWGVLDPKTPPARGVTPPAARPAGNLAGAGDRKVWPLVVVWGALAVAAMLGGGYLARRWRTRTAYLLTIPVILLTLFQLFDNLSRMLPSNW